MNGRERRHRAQLIAMADELRHEATRLIRVADRVGMYNKHVCRDAVEMSERADALDWAVARIDGMAPLPAQPGSSRDDRAILSAMNKMSTNGEISATLHDIAKTTRIGIMWVRIAVKHLEDRGDIIRVKTGRAGGPSTWRIMRQEVAA